MSTMDAGSRGLGASCAMHAEHEATSTCARCGNFMCDVCSEQGTQTLCPVCRERTGQRAFPLRRDTWNFGALWDLCFESFRREWLMLSVAMLVATIIGMVASFASNIASAVGQATGSTGVMVVLVLLAFLLQTVVQGVMGMGMLRVVMDVLEGGRADIGRLFTQVHKAGRYLVTILLTFVLVGLPLLVLFGVLVLLGTVATGHSLSQIFAGEVFREGTPPGFALMGVFIGAALVTTVPAIYFGLPLYLLQAELTHEEDVSPMEAVRHCYVLARGERLSILGISFIAALVGMAGVFACCIGVIPALALGQLLVCGLYFALRQGSELEKEPL